MRKKIEWNWESLDEGTRRVKVIGGWLVNTQRRYGNGKATTFDQALAFIPDRDHEWTISAPFNPSNPGTLHPKVNASDFESPK